MHYLEMFFQNQIHLQEIGSNDKLLQKLIAENCIMYIHSTEPTLSDIFMDMTGAQLD